MTAQSPAADGGSRLHVITVDDADGMVELGRRLASVLRAGDLVVLDGPLGAGKTTLVRGIGEGLQVRGAVSSPTFVISRVHPSQVGGPALVHVDAYRLGSVLEVEDLDLDSSVADCVTVVEWGAGRVEALAPDPLLLRIERDEHSDRREVSITGGSRWRSVAWEGLASGLH